MLKGMNEEQLKHYGSDPQLEGRIQSFELAFRMQAEAPELMDIGKESKATLDLYGINEKPTDNFGRQCLLARRFCEKGVRFVQATHSYKWDQHGDLKNGHTNNALEVDKPIAGLLADLKSRGLLKDTLVLWGGEFGRTPTAQGNDGATTTHMALRCGWRARASSPASCTARPMTTATTPCRTKCTFTTCTPRCCTCWASNIKNSRTAMVAATTA